MIPSTNGFLTRDYVIAEPASKAYRMDYDRHTIRGYADGKKAVEQAVYKILFTERYQYIIYSWYYGVELEALFGQPISYVLPEIKRRITEALLQDSRIEAVDNFIFEIGKGKVHTTFTVHSIYGEFPFEKAVNI